MTNGICIPFICREFLTGSEESFMTTQKRYGFDNRDYFDYSSNNLPEKQIEKDLDNNDNNSK